MRRIAAILCVSALVFSLAACEEKQQTSTEGNTTEGSIGGERDAEGSIVGKVTEIDGTSVTLQLGEMRGGGRGGQRMDRDGMPSGKPDGEKGGMPSGKPDGEKGSMPSGRPDGEKGGVPSGKPDGSGFEAGEESQTFDLTNVSIRLEQGSDTTEGSMEDISVDSILMIRMDGDEVESVTVRAAGESGEEGDGDEKRE